MPWPRKVISTTRVRRQRRPPYAALAWVLGIAAAGYFFGNLPWVRQHLEKIIWGLILVPGLIAIFGAWRAGRQQQAA